MHKYIKHHFGREDFAELASNGETATKGNDVEMTDIDKPALNPEELTFSRKPAEDDGYILNEKFKINENATFTSPQNVKVKTVQSDLAEYES